MIGLSASTATVIAAILTGLLGLLPFFLERKKRVDTEKAFRRRVWNDISKVRGLMTDLEKDASAGVSGPGSHQAVGKLSIMLRDLLREACVAEDTMSVEVVRKWRATGKLASDWQEQLVLMMLESEEISEQDIVELTEKFGSVEELPEDHSMRAKP